MDHSSIFGSIFIIFIILSLLVRSSLSVDNQFEACVPKKCGDNLSIRFPFWISGEHESYCGHPFFRINCTNNEPILSISNDQYIVRNIFHTNQSVLVSGANELEDNCPIPRRNLTQFSVPFTLSSNNMNLYFFYNCTSNPVYPTHQIPCAINKTTRHHSFFVYVREEEGLGTMTAYEEKCDSVVKSAVDDEGMSYRAFVEADYLETLRRGFLLEWGPSNCTGCEASGGHCGFKNGEFICFCRDKPYSKVCNNGTARKKVIAAIIAAGTLAALITMATILRWCWLRKKSNGSIILWKKKSRNGRAVEAFFKDCEFLAPRKFKYKDIQRMTNSFNDKVGQGGFGSVFKGKLPDGHMVAVKVLNETKGDGNDFINEVASISRTSHVNIVTLLGFCINGPQRALVYEFMPNGSLEKFIYGERPLQTRHLGWVELYRVAIGIARGLEYLHRGCNTRIVHFDIKPHNILLDENFIPKIADFGLSKLSNVTQSIVSMTGARGTPGYIAPELVSRGIGEVSHKSDVYSYGMMVLEMVGGRKNIDERVTNLSEIYFPHWIHKRLDMNEGLGLHGVTSLEDHGIARKMILVGLWCIQINPTSRPPMSKVLEMLEGSLEALQLPPKPYLSSLSDEDEGSHSSVSSL